MVPPTAHVAGQRFGGPSRAWHWLQGYLPQGRGLPQNEWRVRHRAVVVIILAHAVGLAIFGLTRGIQTPLALGESALIAALGLGAAIPVLTRRMRSGVAAIGLVMSSAVLVQFSGGVIEAHFHFFVVVALISMYQDWVPFLLAIAFVALDHGLLGTLAPTWVFNHPGALANPWKWAIIHAVMVLSESVALLVVWRANEQARAETDRVLQSAGEGLLGIDADCNVTFANPAALRLARRDEGDLIGKPLYSIVLGSDDRPVFAPDVLRQNPESFTIEAFLAQPGGGRLPVEVLCNPIEGHGHEEGAVVAIRDLTDRLRAESERTQAVTQSRELEHLKEVNGFKTRFMNMAAHELNTPLTPIRLQMHMLKQRTDAVEADPNRRSVGLLDRNFQRLYGLVQDLMDSTRLQGDRLPVRPVPTDLAGLLRDLADSVRPAASEAGIAFHVELPATLHCKVDSARIAQGVNNLLMNALKFTPSGGNVSLRAQRTNGMVRIEVADTGVGMAPEQITRLFQPFEQVHESQIAERQGSGLGLYITRGIVELHGGKVWVESAGPGSGSTFIVTLPDGGATQATDGMVSLTPKLASPAP